MTPTPEDDPATRSNSGSIDGIARRPSSDQAGQDLDKSAPLAEKTISCVSCRRRKLKCDRVKPKCATCVRLCHDCEYPERRRNLGSKRRNMKELEARLAQVETQLTSEMKPPTTAANPSVDAEWDVLAMEMNLDLAEDDAEGTEFATAPMGQDQPTMPCGDFFSMEVISLGLDEPLPPDEMTRDLTQIYFDAVNPTVPMIHQYRFRAAMDLPPAARPPVALRYIMWSLAAMKSEKWQAYSEILYRRARKYAEAAEMKGVGEVFVSVYYAQAWSLIASYEANMLYFSRAWINVGKCVRLCQMLGLQRLDAEGPELKRIIPPPRDWTELEERRRTFWAAYYCDRWASAGTGWPMVIDEKVIRTNLPASDEAFQTGVKEETVTLASTLTGDGASNLTSFGAVIFSAAVFGHNFEHLHRSGPEENPQNLNDGAFWRRHRSMDNTLSSTFMFLPDNLRLPSGVRDINVPFVHMNLFASIICLGQTATKTAELYKLDLNFIKQSKARTLLAASEIANIMRLISHLDPVKMNSWMGFCLYTAASVFLQDLSTDQQEPQSLSNLEFLMQAMNALAKRHTVIKHFIAQLELNIEASRLGKRPPPIFQGLEDQRSDQKWAEGGITKDIFHEAPRNACSQIMESISINENAGRNDPCEVPSFEDFTYTTFLKLPDRSRELNLDKSPGSSDQMPIYKDSKSDDFIQPHVAARDAEGSAQLFTTKLQYGSPGSDLNKPSKGGSSTNNNSDPDLAFDTPSADSSSSNNNAARDSYPSNQPSKTFIEGSFQASPFDMPSDWTFDPTSMSGLQDDEFAATDFLNSDIDMTALKDQWADVIQPGPD